MIAEAKTLTARTVFEQLNGEVTRAWYEHLNSLGPHGKIAVALFRAQKTSTRAKVYRARKFRHAAYDTKSWSIDQATTILGKHGADLGFTFGWKQDHGTVFGRESSWVFYCDIPRFGQCSFHSPTRGAGPDYKGEWSSLRNSADVIFSFCDSILAGCVAGANAPE